MITLAKEQLSAYIILFLLGLFTYKVINVDRRKIINLGLWALWTFVSFFTLFVICTHDCMATTWSLGPSIYEIIEGLFLRPTGYYFLLNAELFTFLHNPLIGVGFGNFEFYIKTVQELGYYPADMPLMMSHNLYSGLLAELGIVAIIIFIIFGWMHKKLMKHFRKLRKLQNYYIVFLLFWFLFLVGIGCSNFLFVRHHWIALGIISLIYFESKESQNQFLSESKEVGVV
jgi:uncharacterized membrane protein (Fun14 family)